MNIREQIQVMQAYADNPSLAVQWRRHDRWFDVASPKWNWEQCEYRIKPAPRKFWIVVDPGACNSVHEDEQLANNVLNHIKQYRNSQAYIIPVQGIVS